MYCAENPDSKYKGKFDAYLEDKKVWPYSPFKKDVCWTKEKNCPACALDDKNKKAGFGNWCKRAYNDYTCEEFYAAQGHDDRVRTADLFPEDAIKREITDDDSLLDSDWHERTG